MNNQSSVIQPEKNTVIIEHKPKESIGKVVNSQTIFPNETPVEQKEEWITYDPTKKHEITSKVHTADWQRKLERLEKNLQNESCKFQSEGFGHLKRTATNARIFFRKPEKFEYRIGLLSLLHQKTIRDISNYNLPEEDAHDVSDFLRTAEHMNSEGGVCCKQIDDNVAKAVIMSDRLIEGSGAYGVRRACFHAGEDASASDEKITDRERIRDELIAQLGQSIQRNSFPMLAARLIIQQEDWKNRFVEALQENEKWAVDTGEKLFELGFGKQNFEASMIDIQSTEEKARPLMVESTNYLTGKNSNKLTDMLSDFF